MKLVEKNNYLQNFDLYKELKNYPLAGPSANFIASILLSLLLFIFAIKPSLLTINKLKKKIEDYKKIDKELLIKKNNLEEISQTYSQNQPQLDLVNKALPDEHNFLLLEKEVRYFIQKNDLKLENLSFSSFSVFDNLEDLDQTEEIKEKNNYQNLSIALSGQGNYNDIKNMIQMLQDNLRILNINSISLTNEGKEGKIKINLNINSYYFKNNFKNNL